MNTVLHIEVSDLHIEVADALRELESAGVAYCPYCDNSDMLQPNDETLAAFAEAREGKCRTYTNVDDLLADVNS